MHTTDRCPPSKGGQNGAVPLTGRPAAPSGGGGGIEVFESGTPVWIGGDSQSNGISAIVVEVAINGGRVSYRCVWWSEKSRHNEWLEAIEVHAVDDSRRQQIGFRG